MLDAEAEVQRTEKWQLIKNQKQKYEARNCRNPQGRMPSRYLLTNPGKETSEGSLTHLLLRIQSLLDVMFGAANQRAED